jgi:DNA mismatch endonuclease (patch repair protein)
VDTKPELAVRRGLHRRGLRYRVDHPIVTDKLRVRPDIVFPRQHVAVFIDGCFWHACERHGTDPQQNADYWATKLARNVARDRLVNKTLAKAGWLVARFWEHESVEDVIELIHRLIIDVAPPSPGVLTGAGSTQRTILDQGPT